MKPTGQRFMEMTRYEHVSASDQFQRVPAPSLEKPFPPDGKFTNLPTPDEISVPPLDLRRAIEARRSIRRYSREPLSIEELAYLFWCTQGITHVQEPYFTFRNVPSAGGRHSFETYVLANRVDGLKHGIYRYLAFSNRLLEVDTRPDVVDRAMAACLGQAFVRSSAATFIWSSIIYRMAWRYAERSYRLVHLDAGHVCQNLYLAACQLGCGTCAIGAFDDQMMAELLDIDGIEEFVVYCAAVGKKE